jgi:hypothetical protein
MPDCVVLVPMLGRPWTVEPLVRSLQESGAPAEPLFIVGTDDDAVWDACEGYRTLEVKRRCTGDYAAKINAGVRATDEPWLFLGACDIRFHRGWWAACMDAAEGGAQVIGTNDLCNPRTASGDLSTHTLISREYAELPTVDGGPGPLHEGYRHEYVDSELRGTAIARGVWAHQPAAVVEHLHPMAGKAEWDDSYRGQAGRMVADRSLFRTRRRLWT